MPSSPGSAGRSGALAGALLSHTLLQHAALLAAPNYFWMAACIGLV
ncbi:hypothetical protein [Massilia sp. HP4]|nr:hypothetical protein [Massilia sp. HP4]